MRILLWAAFVIIGLTVSAQPALAITDPTDLPDQISDPGVGCLDWGWEDIVKLDPDCVHQKATSNNGTQQRARAYSRYWKMALMAGSQMMLAYEWAKDVAGSWKDTYKLLAAAVKGFDLREPGETAYILRRATFDLRIRMNQQSTMLSQHQIPWDDDTRFQVINTAVMNALQAASLVEDNATSLSERGLGMRLTFGDASIRMMFAGGDSSAHLAEPGGLPMNASEDMSDTEFFSIYDDIFASQPQTVSGRPLRSVAGPGLNSGQPNLRDEQLRCPIDGLANEKPEVLYQRAQIMATGAQIGSQGLSAEAAVQLEKLDALADLEVARERALEYLTALKIFRSF